MPARTTVLAVAALYLIVCLILGLWPARRTSDSALGYVAGDRTLGLLLMYFITGATIFSAAAFLGGPGRAYSQGAAAFYMIGYGALGFVPFYFIGPRAARVGRAYGFVTQAEMVAHRYGDPKLAAVMAVVSLAAFVPYLALQMKGAGYVLAACSQGLVPTWLGALIVYGVVGVYVLFSGVLGVGWTNTFQGIFMMIMAWSLGIYLPYVLHGGVQPMFENIIATHPDHLLPPGGNSNGGRWTWGEYSSAVFVSTVGFSIWPHTFMKAFSAKSDETLRRTVLLYPTFQIFLVPLFLIGFAGIGFDPPPPRADQVLPHLLMNLEIPALIVGLFCAGALAASMSSGDAMAHAAGSIAVRDGFVTTLGRPLTPHAERAAIRATIVAILVGAYLVAVLYQGSLILLLLTAYGAVVQFAPGVVLALYDRRTPGAAVLVGLVAGAALTAVFNVWPDLRPWPLHAGLYGLAVNVVGIAALRAYLPADARPAADAFIRRAASSDASDRPGA